MSFHTPARGVKNGRHWFKAIDWPLLAAFTALILVLMLGWGFLRSLEQNQALVDQGKDSAESNRVLVEEVTTLRERLTAVNSKAQRERRQAAREREKLLRQQSIMIRLLRDAGVIQPGENPGGVIVVTPGGGNGSTDGSSQPHSAPQGSSGHGHQPSGSGPQNGSDGSGHHGGGGGGQNPPPDDNGGIVGDLLDAPCKLAPLPTC